MEVQQKKLVISDDFQVMDFFQNVKAHLYVMRFDPERHSDLRMLNLKKIFLVIVRFRLTITFGDVLKEPVFI